MLPQFSTFDKLVNTLSNDETQTMLARIAESMKASEEIQKTTAQETVFINRGIQKKITIADESFFVRFWLKFLSFIQSIPIEKLYENELLKRIGKNLHQNHRNYVNTKKRLFLTDFFNALRELRKTQLFFLSLLSAYDSEKGNFYLLVSSFSLPDIYIQLIDNTDPFITTETDEEQPNVRSKLLKNIDNTFALISPEQKAEMYRYAQAIEWIKNFCELPLDKLLLRFNTQSATHIFCPMKFIGNDIMELAVLLEAIKPIPNAVLRALFLLSKPECFNGSIGNSEKETADFITEATQALQGITHFIEKIPILDCARYATHNIDYTAHHSNGGEDWFLLFKNAWKQRFNDRWTMWIAEQRKTALTTQMLEILKPAVIEGLPHRPWEDAWIVLRLKREFAFCFLRTFFATLYNESIQPVLKIILLEGNFYRRENLTDYTSAFTALEKQASAISIFEERLSPEGEIGSTFAQHKGKTITSIKSKNSLEILMKSVETDAKQIIKTSQSSFKMLTAILNGFVEGNKGSIYAPLINWTVIQGDKNMAFRSQVGKVKQQIAVVSALLSEAETIELDGGL